MSPFGIADSTVFFSNRHTNRALRDKALRRIFKPPGAPMGKQGTDYARVERDLYPTPYWVVAALAEHLNLTGMPAWACACGDGGVVGALLHNGCARIYARQRSPLRLRQPPVILYTPANAAAELPYNGNDDFSRSIGRGACARRRRRAGMDA